MIFNASEHIYSKYFFFYKLSLSDLTKYVTNPVLDVAS